MPGQKHTGAGVECRGENRRRQEDAKIISGVQSKPRSSHEDSKVISAIQGKTRRSQEEWKIIS